MVRCKSSLGNKLYAFRNLNFSSCHSVQFRGNTMFETTLYRNQKTHGSSWTPGKGKLLEFFLYYRHFKNLYYYTKFIQQRERGSLGYIGCFSDFIPPPEGGSKKKILVNKERLSKNSTSSHYCLKKVQAFILSKNTNYITKFSKSFSPFTSNSG